MKQQATPGKGAGKKDEKKAKAPPARGIVERPAQSGETAPAHPPQKAEPAAVTTPQMQAVAPEAPLPGAWVLPWQVQVTGSTSTAYVLSWLLGVRVAASGPAPAYRRAVDGDVLVIVKRAKLAELLGLTAEAVEGAIKGLRERGFIVTTVQEDEGKKVTAFTVKLDALRNAKDKLAPSKKGKLE